MRIDPCPGCGQHINIASDHAPGCTTRSLEEKIGEEQAQKVEHALANHDEAKPHPRGETK